MRTLIASTLMLLTLTSVSFSQQHEREAGENTNTLAAKQDAAAAKAKEERKEQDELDAHYKAALGQMNAPATKSADPWADLRQTSSPAGKRQ